ncbi:MAG: DUF5717 family protein [Defluviitaleaceae bacterium]|nr:DUF5717 family protein [Defluviitaleaceae bacterium]
MRAVKKEIARTVRLWLGYAFGANDASRVFLQHAHHAAITAFRRNEIHLPNLTLATFIAIEAGHYDTAKELLDMAWAYRSFLKSHEAAHYAELCFLYAFLEIRQNRLRAARKHWRNLAAISAGVSGIGMNSTDMMRRVMLGRLHLAVGEFEEAYAHLSGAFAGGCRSPYVFEGLYRYYKTARIAHGAELLAVLHYAAARGADITDIAANGSADLSTAIAHNPTLGEKLYAVSQYAPLLKDICALRIRDDDQSAEAYALYLSAERKQVTAPHLYAHLMQTAFANNIERVNLYPLSQFLQTANMPPDLAVYVYHLMLTDRALADHLPAHITKILQLAVRCLEEGKTGRHVNSLYYFYWKRSRAMQDVGMASTADESPLLLQQAEAIVRDHLTLFELTAGHDSAVRFVYVTDAAKRGMDVYEMTPSHTVQVESASTNLSYTCLGAGRRTVLHERLVVRPMVRGVDVETFRHFFDQGDRRFYVLRRLADAYMDAPALDAIPVLEAMLAQKNILAAYKMRLLLTLGRVYFESGDYTRARESYQAADENTPDLPRQLLACFLHTGDFAAAAALVGRRFRAIADDFLLAAITQLLPHEVHHQDLAAAAHYLLTRLDIQPVAICHQLISLTLTHFPYSRQELVDLTARYNAHNAQLDKRLLENSLWMATPDEAAQAAFVRVYKNPDCVALIEPFVEMCAYHMLVVHFCPDYETLHTLEKYYLTASSADDILGLALAQTYLRHHLTTLQSDRIIADALAAQQKNGLLLPVFKSHKPAQLPYIEKHQPFLYKSMPDKEIVLYYRISPDAPFTPQPMQYLRFGMYLACVPLFYGEEITYYYSEEMPNGSIATREQTQKNNTPYLHKEADTSTDIAHVDPFFTINNAIILEQMYKYEQVEQIIGTLVRDVAKVRSRRM